MKKHQKHRFVLDDEPPIIGYSPMEKELFSLLPQNGNAISSEQILEKYDGWSKSKPFHARTILVGTLRTLIRKVDANNETFRIIKTTRRGPIPIEYRVERRV